MRDLTNAECTMVSGGDKKKEPQLRLESVTVTAKPGGGGFGFGLGSPGLFGSGGNPSSGLPDGLSFEDALSFELDEDELLQLIQDEAGAETSDPESDMVAFGTVGMSTNSGIDVGVSVTMTSDNRAFLNVSMGIEVSIPVIDVSTGFATSSDVFSGPGFTTGAGLETTASSSGAAFGIGPQAGTSVSFGFEVPSFDGAFNNTLASGISDLPISEKAPSGPPKLLSNAVR